ncbi:hypothetical protein Cma02nite_22770 [Cellulomonas marina]|uniref:PAS domain S-box-containing protein/diguanylate cyclase (GGDEF) domain-containing protein n=1 Tax=Cellulomonas marina TaxID=988821 RepID=A0A1I0YD35_9CELL|nr:hypothetical protein Cma02nite_22770 [Cellulomonas marina]SFB11151.1 PAS domain S-box-containing protein/diguanylate cyclase (GGDEF) domain-containing protein [Cellulomonas marina]
MDRAVAVVTLAVIAGATNALTGTGGALGTAFAAANAAQAVVACAVTRGLQRRHGREAWRLRDLADLAALVAGAVAGSVAAAGIGPVALHLLRDEPLLPAAGAWVLRNAASTFVLTAVLLRVADRAGDRSRLAGPLRARPAELLAACGVVVVGYGVVFAQPVQLPVAFLVLPLSMWLALRFDTTVAALHLVPVGVLVVVATTAGLGPFAVHGPAARVLLAQAFVAVGALVTLVLALQRDERHAATEHLVASERRADRHAALMETVFATTADALSVYDERGVAVLRNPAAQEMFPDLPDGVDREGWGSYFGLSHVDGAPVDPEELPVVRALRGQVVDDVDLLVRTPGEPDGRVLNLRAHPMPGSSRAGWSGGAVLAARDVTAVRRATEQITHARDRYAALLAAATEQAIVACDTDGAITVFNAGAERMLGYRAEEVVGRPIALLHDPRELVERGTELDVPATAVVATMAARRDSTARRWTYRRRDGATLPVSLTISPTSDEYGDRDGAICVASDITSQVATEARLHDSERLFRLAFDEAPIAMMIVGLQGEDAGLVLRTNATTSVFTGLTEAELRRRDVHSLTHPDDRDACRASFRPFLDGACAETREEKRYLHADGTVRRGMMTATVVAPADGGGTTIAEPYLLCLVEDVTARRQAEEALRHQALHDALTGLPNRTLLVERLAAALADGGAADGREADGRAPAAGLLFCDLDGFKSVNDSAGHAAGDGVLREVASRFAACVGPAVTLARLGGDEFAVVLPGAVDESALRRAAERLVAALCTPVRADGAEHVLGVSVGTALGLPDESADAVIARADAAMYAAKRAGKNRVHAAGLLPRPRPGPDAERLAGVASRGAAEGRPTGSSRHLPARSSMRA